MGPAPCGQGRAWLARDGRAARDASLDRSLIRDGSQAALLAVSSSCFRLAWPNFPSPAGAAGFDRIGAGPDPVPVLGRIPTLVARQEERTLAGRAFKPGQLAAPGGRQGGLGAGTTRHDSARLGITCGPPSGGLRWVLHIARVTKHGGGR